MNKVFHATVNGFGLYPFNILIAVKLTFVLTAVFALQATAGALAQKIDLKVNNRPLVTVLQELRKQSGYAFLYDESDLAKSRPVSVHVKNKDLADVLSLIFEKQPLTYGVKGRVISVIPRDRRPGAQRAVTGKVTDAFDDTPLAGVSVSIAGRTGGTTTDTAGVYELVANEGDSLIFSFVGYVTQKAEVGQVKLINIRLSQDTESLDEAVVVAFGKQAKESVVSSITTVNVKDLRTPSSNLTTALAGRLAGMVAYQTTGAPGEEDAQFFVRSVTSFGSGLTSPLILIDNIEVTSRDLARLNPDDIASFSILKDASATALYGARGANGVVLVTTKEGEIGK